MQRPCEVAAAVLAVGFSGARATLVPIPEHPATPTEAAMHHDEIGRGWGVYDTTGDKIGDVADLGSSYLLVQKGLLFIKDIYIPTSEIRSTDTASQRVYLNVAKDQIDSMGWDNPPTDGEYATGGSGYTSDADQTRGIETYGQDVERTAGDAESQRLRLHEEELQAQTRREQAGEVNVSKRVVEDEQSLEVPVTHEEVQVKRVRVDRDATGAEPAFQDDGETIRVPVTAETIEVTKQPRVVEEIEISKRQVTERQTVSDTVRREEADVTHEGDVVVEGSTPERVGSGADATSRATGDDELDPNRQNTQGW
jgi:uncharacterized protein (TIGR02271 family)